MRTLFAFCLLGVIASAQTRQTAPHMNPPVVGTTATTGPHQATINWSNSTCTTTAPCSLQVYRAQCGTPTNCPAYSAGSSSWKTLDMSANLSPVVGMTGTTWQYVDKDTTMQDSTTYAWVATCSYTGSATASPASTNFTGTTNNGTPPAPVLSSNGNSVN